MFGNNINFSFGNQGFFPQINNQFNFQSNQPTMQTQNMFDIFQILNNTSKPVVPPQPCNPLPLISRTQTPISNPLTSKTPNRDPFSIFLSLLTPSPINISDSEDLNDRNSDISIYADTLIDLKISALERSNKKQKIENDEDFSNSEVEQVESQPKPSSKRKQKIEKDEEPSSSESDEYVESQPKTFSKKKQKIEEDEKFSNSESDEDVEPKAPSKKTRKNHKDLDVRYSKKSISCGKFNFNSYQGARRTVIGELRAEIDSLETKRNKQLNNKKVIVKLKKQLKGQNKELAEKQELLDKTLKKVKKLEAQLNQKASR